MKIVAFYRRESDGPGIMWIGLAVEDGKSTTPPAGWIEAETVPHDIQMALHDLIVNQYPDKARRDT